MMKTYDRSILRLVDANLNRAIEGIRVLEESARMLFDDATLTHELKSLRHSLTTVFSDDMFRTAMIVARGSERDVLRHGETVSESTRGGVADLVRANASRAREAVRNIEEYGKLISGGISEQCKGIRFRLYDAEKLLICRIVRSEKAAADRLRLMVMIDPPEDADAGSMASSAAIAGAGVIICRDSRYPGAMRVRHLEMMVEGIGNREATLLGWDRADIAMAGGADGVLLAPDGMGMDAARAISPPSWVLGKTVADAGMFDPRCASDNGADFVYIDADSGDDGPFPEPEDVKECIEAMPAPVIAISPPEEEYIADLFDIGVAGIALHADSIDPGMIEKTRVLVDRLAGAGE